MQESEIRIVISSLRSARDEKKRFETEQQICSHLSNVLLGLQTRLQYLKKD